METENVDRVRYYEEQNIHNEINDMFLTLSGGQLWGNDAMCYTRSKSFNADLAAIKTGRDKDGKFMPSLKSVYKINEDKKLQITKNRNGSFYGKTGNIKCAEQLLQEGFSIRQTAKALTMSTNTVGKLLKQMGDIKCKCGTLLRDHKGWCKYRFERSDKRMEFMKSWGKQASL